MGISEAAFCELDATLTVYCRVCGTEVIWDGNASTPKVPPLTPGWVHTGETICRAPAPWRQGSGHETLDSA